MVRLEATTVVSISMWFGALELTEDFNQIRSIWLPVQTKWVISIVFFGTSELNISYGDYWVLEKVATPGRSVQSG